MIGGLWLLAVVDKIEGEACWLSVWHTADALLVEPYFGVLNLLGALIEQGARLVEDGATLWLVGTAGGTSDGAIDETASILDVLHA